jgi:hypothetical protein
VLDRTRGRTTTTTTSSTPAAPVCLPKTPSMQVESVQSPTPRSAHCTAAIHRDVVQHGMMTGVLLRLTYLGVTPCCLRLLPMSDRDKDT